MKEERYYEFYGYRVRAIMDIILRLTVIGM